MSDPVLLFVNDRPVRVPAGTPAGAAVGATDPALADRIAAGTAYLTDGRGIRLSPGEPVFPGAILRVVLGAPRGDEADAHA